MTWEELGKEIATMPKRHRTGQVIFAESYDEGCCHPVDIGQATEDIAAAWGKDADDEDKGIMVPKGAPFLS